MATKCRCDPTLEATGMKCFSMNAVNLSIIAKFYQRLRH